MSHPVGGGSEGGKTGQKTLVERLGFQDPDLATGAHDEILFAITAEHIRNWSGANNVECGQIDGLRAEIQLDETTRTLAFLEKGKVYRWQGLKELGHQSPFWEGSDKNGWEISARGRECLESKRRLVDYPIRIRWTAKKIVLEPEVRLEYERPVMSGKYLIGFIDLVATVHWSRPRSTIPATFLEQYADGVCTNLGIPDLATSYRLEEMASRPKVLEEAVSEYLDGLSADVQLPETFCLACEVKPEIRNIGVLLRQINTYRAYEICHRFSPGWHPDFVYWAVVSSANPAAQRVLESQGIMFIPWGA